MFGEDFNPYVYELMDSCMDHKHFAGSDWTKSRGGQGEHDVLGGGHSHAGAMIYQGDNWPDNTCAGGPFNWCARAGPSPLPSASGWP